MTRDGAAVQAIRVRHFGAIAPRWFRFGRTRRYDIGPDDREGSRRFPAAITLLACAVCLAACEAPSEIGRAVERELANDESPAAIALNALGYLSDARVICLIPESMTPAEVVPVRTRNQFRAALRPVADIRTGLEATNILYVSPTAAKLVEVEWSEFGLVSNPRDAGCHLAGAAVLVPVKDRQTDSVYFDFAGLERAG